MSIIKYGVMIPFDDSHMWVSKDSKDQELKPLLFDTRKKHIIMLIFGGLLQWSLNMK